MDLFDRLRAAAATEWASYVDHEFVRQLEARTLPEAAFRTYLVQDYLFLIQFARAYALAIYKSRHLSDMRAAQAGLSAILDVEINLHIRLCGRWGLSPVDLEAAPEHAATVAYTRFVLDCGASGDLLDLHTALAPCVIGYAEIAARLAPDGVTGLADHRIASGLVSMPASPIERSPPRPAVTSTNWRPDRSRTGVSPIFRRCSPKHLALRRSSGRWRWPMPPNHGTTRPECAISCR